MFKYLVAILKGKPSAPKICTEDLVEYTFSSEAVITVSAITDKFEDWLIETALEIAREKGRNQIETVDLVEANQKWAPKGKEQCQEK